MKNVLKQIEQFYSSFSKGQKKIADYIINQYDKAAYITAAKLGKEVDVSESTVVRFAVTLGYEGFPELQSALREIIKTKLTALQRFEILSDKMNNEDVLTKIMSGDISKLKVTMENLNRDDFDGSVDAILKAKTIYILGVRSASSLASFMGFYFNLLFDNVKIVQTTSISEVFEQILRVGENDVVIGITFPRYSRRTVKALEYAKSRNAAVVAITDTSKSPIVPYSDYKLYAKNDTASFVDSLVAPMSIINALIAALGMQKKEETSTIFNKLEKIWEQYDVYNKEHSDE
ncbi:MAG: MurR/RpiR family transcriptional regulator [Clostridia bacterium]|nr:MurR/RpiR family transcriptional regulator [Clostridia bacterium]